MGSALPKRLFYICWFLIITVPFVTISFSLLPQQLFSQPAVMLNTFQRFTGMLAFVLLFIQIIIGKNMDRLVQVIGSRIYWFHITEGIFAYGLVLIHPLMESLIVYQFSQSFYQTLLALKPSLNNLKDMLLIYGRIGLVLVSVGFFAGFLRTKPVIRRNWRAFHIINYFAFYAVWIHARVGSDVNTAPFAWLYWFSFALVTYSVVTRFTYPLIKNLRLLLAEKVSQKA